MIEGIIGLIGCGNMGSAIVKGLIDKSIVSTDSIIVADKDKSRSSRIVQDYNCRKGDIGDIASEAKYLIVAVKPQDSAQLLRDIAGAIEGQSIISIMAGVTIGKIEGLIGKKVPVTRSMPNMAAVLGESITGVAFNDEVRDKNAIVEILLGIGKVVEVAENQLDAVTAVSGSGPAYLFYLAESMINAGVEEGLDRDTAEALTVQTLYGASKLLRDDPENEPRDLIKAVASKGGTTEAALSIFDQKKMDAIVGEALAAARKRSQELSE
jgi:pyrroline-5-carboxylate reductase